MWPAKRAGWGCKPRIAALRASSGLRPTVRYSVGSPGKRKRHRGWFPDRGATHLIRTTNTTAPAGLPPVAHLQNRSYVTRRHSQVGGGIGQRFIKGTDGIQHAEYRIQPVLMHDANIGGKTAAIPITGTLKRFATLATPTGTLPWIVWLSIRPSPVITKSASATRSASCSASVTISMPGRN